jgi:pyrimidine-nucleoside phosphorylase
MLGAGRQKQDDAIDPMIGIRIARVRGESVHEGDTLATVYHRSDCPPDEAAIKRLRDAFTLVDDAVEPAPMILERIG